MLYLNLLVHSRHRYDRVVTEDGIVTQDVHINEKVTDPYVTAGLGMRYGLSKKVALTLDTHLNKLTHEVKGIAGWGRPITYYSVGLGLRYTFR